MIQKFVAAVLIVAGAILLYTFAVHGSISAKERIDPKKGISLTLPLYSFAKEYPKNVLIFTAGVLGVGIGIALFWIKGMPSFKPICGLFLLNSIVMLLLLWITFVGAKVKADPKLLGMFSITMGSQMLAGVVLLVLSFKEKPLAILNIAAGGLLYVICLLIGCAALL